MISDERLRMAAGEYEQALLSSLPDADQCEHSFSPKFEKKMRHLCHKVKYASVYSVTKRVACAVIAIVLCGSILMMLNTDVRAAVVGWIKETYNSFVRYSFASNVEPDAPLTYEITELPKGYTLLSKQETDAGNIAIYHNSDGQIMQFGCYSAESGMLFVGGSEYDHSQVRVSGRNADLYIAKDSAHSNTVVWGNANESMLFQLTAFLEKDVLLQVAESVSPIINDEGDEPVAQAYDFERVPEGYIFIDRMDTDSGTTILYTRENGHFLELSYEFNIDKNTFFFKPEDHTYTQENINGTTMDIYLSNDPQYASSIIWSTNDKVIFIISANCDKDTLIQLTRCVVPIY